MPMFSKTLSADALTTRRAALETKLRETSTALESVETRLTEALALGEGTEALEAEAGRLRSTLAAGPRALDAIDREIAALHLAAERAEEARLRKEALKKAKARRAIGEKVSSLIEELAGQVRAFREIGPAGSIVDLGARDEDTLRVLGDRLAAVLTYSSPPALEDARGILLRAAEAEIQRLEAKEAAHA